MFNYFVKFHHIIDKCNQHDNRLSTRMSEKIVKIIYVDMYVNAQENKYLPGIH